ncbi:SigE family RNA polymerase sigma factor [Streptomyces tsukubensis]|uniref:RNA polymerase subunit sigma-24 n=1 Tax=Streptomyces tsukubensis TaxID=83656 RepID=UPI001D04F0CD
MYEHLNKQLNKDEKAHPRDAAEQDASPGTPESVDPESVAPGSVDPEPLASDSSAPDSFTAAPSADDPFTVESFTAENAFDALYAHTAPTLVRQTYVLTGRRALAQESVVRAFHLAWQRWPEVAVDRDPVGWVRAAAHEYAISPWHRFRPGHHGRTIPPSEPADRVLLSTLLKLPPSYRRTLLLYDGVGLGLPETAAETEASTPAAASRILHAREAVTFRMPELAGPDELRRRLDSLARGEKLTIPKAAVVRTDCERGARFWTRAAITFTVLIIGATSVTLSVATDHYEAPQAPGTTVSGVPPRMGPGPLSHKESELHHKLDSEPLRGPGRLLPQPH